MNSSSPTARLPARAREGPVVLGRYRLARQLGAGGFGTVWSAYDQRLEREVAVKVLPRERILAGRFEREARAAARLSHPGIVTLYEAAVDDDGAYLVSELVRGATLAQLLDAGALSDRDLVQIGIALCDALAHAHAQGVVHRDVKPSNVLVPDRPSTPTEPAAKLTDFGVARVVGGDSLTRTGDVLGTAAYMAPEQAEGREAGASADLYSLALVLYEALTGVNPIRTGSAAQRTRRLGAHLPPLRRQRRDLPRELGRGIDLALRPKPRERGGIDELRCTLLDCLEQVADRPGVVTSPWSELTGGSFAPDQPEEPPEIQPFRSPARAEAAEDERPRSGWQARGLAGAVAAALTAWLAADVLSPSPVAPALAGLVAGVLVATLPRTGWLALMLASAATLSAQGRTGVALVLLVTAVVPVLVLFRRPALWPIAALAPGLGLIGLAGAWPALAARAGTAWQRAALAATGWIWLVFAAPLAGRGLYTRLPASTPPSSLWMPSAYAAANHMLGPTFRSGLLLPALVWAAGAAVLPWILPARLLALQVVIVTVWSAALVSSTTTVLAAVHEAGVVPSRSIALGAIAAGLVALSGGFSARLRRRAVVPDTEAGLA
jgi:eukaryotic-like serine/threonine-protein kinase